MNSSAQEQLQRTNPASRLGARDLSLIRNPQSVIRNSSLAFTLIELLVVITIIGLLAAIGLPAIKGMTKSNAIAAANRQMLDDLAYARQRAVSDHTTVYVVFIPPSIVNYNFKYPSALISNLWGGQYTTYAMLSLRTVGDQPGLATPKYLTGWRTLPNGVFIATNKFGLYDPNNTTNEYTRAFPVSPSTGPYALYFPYPSVAANSQSLAGLPYIGFNYLGQLISTNNENEAIPLTRGSIFYQRDPNGALESGIADVLETPSSTSTNYTTNVIHIDWLTGKARVERQEVQ